VVRLRSEERNARARKRVQDRQQEKSCLITLFKSKGGW
jgi:hypothetical protein